MLRKLDLWPLITEWSISLRKIIFPFTFLVLWISTNPSSATTVRAARVFPCCVPSVCWGSWSWCVSCRTCDVSCSSCSRRWTTSPSSSRCSSCSYLSSGEALVCSVVSDAMCVVSRCKQTLLRMKLSRSFSSLVYEVSVSGWRGLVFWFVWIVKVYIIPREQRCCREIVRRANVFGFVEDCYISSYIKSLHPPLMIERYFQNYVFIAMLLYLFPSVFLPTD